MLAAGGWVVAQPDDLVEPAPVLPDIGDV